MARPVRVPANQKTGRPPRGKAIRNSKVTPKSPGSTRTKNPVPARVTDSRRFR